MSVGASNFARSVLAFVSGTLFVTFCWYVTATWLVLQENKWLFPNPYVVAEFGINNAPLFLTALKVTGGSTIIGLAAGALTGLLMAVLFHLVPFLERSVLPFISAVPAIPIITIAPIATLVVGSRNAVVFISAFICFFPILVTVLAGLSKGYKPQREYFEMQGATWRARFLYLDAGASLGYFAVGFRTSAPLAAVGALVAEFVSPRGPSEGLGTMVLRYANQTNITGLYASAIACALLGVSISALALLISSMLLKRFPAD